MPDKQRPKIVVDYTQYRNAARAPATSGRFKPKKYTGQDIDPERMMSKAQFESAYILNRPGNYYNDSGDVVEVSQSSPAASPVSTVSRPSSETPMTAMSGSTQWSPTNSILTGSTVNGDDTVQPTWYCVQDTVADTVFVSEVNEREVKRD
jgi:hypothetical protein